MSATNQLTMVGTSSGEQRAGASASSIITYCACTRPNIGRVPICCQRSSYIKSNPPPPRPVSPASGDALAFAERMFDRTLSALSGERQQYLTTINMMADRLSFPDATAGTFRAASWLAAVDMRDRWQDFFQEDPDILPNLQEQYPEVQPPRILIATSNLCSLGLTLHEAHHLVKFDVDFLDEADEVTLQSDAVHKHVTATGRLRPKYRKKILQVPICASALLMTP